MKLLEVATKTGLKVLKSQITKTVLTTLVGAAVQVKAGEAYDKYVIKTNELVGEN